MNIKVLSLGGYQNQTIEHTNLDMICIINTSSMKQPDPYYFETIKMTS